MAANLQTGDKRLFTGGNLRNAVLASMSIPGLLPPVEIDGTLYIDGGVVQNLPISEARTLGADVTIAVFTGVPPAEGVIARNAAAVLGATLDIWRRKNAEAEFPNADVLIAPTPVETMTAFDQVAETIEAGRLAALAALPQIRRVLREANIPLRPRNPANRFLTSGVLSVAEVRVEGVASGRARRLVQRIGLRAGRTMPQARLERRLAAEYERGGWASLAYRLEQTADDKVVVIVEARRRPNNWVGIGLRYDTNENIAAQLRMQHAALAGAVRAEGHFGSFLQGRLEYAVPFPVPVLGDFRWGIEAQHRPLPFGPGESRIRRDHTQVQADVAIEWVRSRYAALETNSKVQYSSLPGLDQQVQAVWLGARFRFDDSGVPHQSHRMTRGARLQIAYDRSLLADINGFPHQYKERLARLESHVALAQPLTRWLSYFGEVDVRMYTLLGIPIWAKDADTEAVDVGGGYFLGGFEPAPAFDTHRVRVPGLPPYAWSASSATVLRAGIHIGRVGDLAMLTVGHTRVSATGPNRDFASYHGLLSLHTPFGPVSGGLALDDRDKLSYYISVGYAF